MLVVGKKQKLKCRESLLENKNLHNVVKKPRKKLLCPPSNVFESQSNVAECVRKLLTDFGRRRAPHIRYLL